MASSSSSRREPRLNPIMRLLDEVSVKEMLDRRERAQVPVYLPSTCTLEECLSVLAEHSFLSVPVTVDDQERHRTVISGHIDVIDIVSFYASTFGSVRLQRQPPTPPRDGFMSIGTLEPILEADWLEAEIGSIVNFSGRNQTLFVSESDSLSSVAMSMTSGIHHRALVKNSQDDRRAAVRSSATDERPRVKDIVSVLSQWDIVCFMADILKKADDSGPERSRSPHYQDAVAMSNTSVRDLGLGTSMFEKEVVSVAADLPVLAALTVFISSHVSMLAVVDDQGRLIGSLSGADLRGIQGDDFLTLTRPIREFLQERSPDSLQPHTILRGDALIDAINMIMSPREHRLHHLWIVDRNRFPVGVCSLTDIMRFFTIYTVPTPSDRPSLLGRLSVTVIRARKLKPSKKGGQRSCYAALRFPGRRRITTPVVPKNNSPRFVNQMFHFDVTTDNIGHDKVFRIEVLDKRTFFADRTLGTIPLDMSWIANGFGASNGSNMRTRTQSKWMPLRHDGKPESTILGELLVRLSYSPVSTT